MTVDTKGSRISSVCTHEHAGKATVAMKGLVLVFDINQKEDFCKYCWSHLSEQSSGTYIRIQDPFPNHTFSCCKLRSRTAFPASRLPRFLTRVVLDCVLVCITINLLMCFEYPIRKDVVSLGSFV